MNESDFIRHLEQNPGDAHSALVFADWLEENRKPAHAEMIRLHHSPDFGSMSAVGESHEGGHIVSPPINTSKNPVKRANRGNNKRPYTAVLKYPLSDGRQLRFYAKIRGEYAKQLVAACNEEAAQ